MSEASMVIYTMVGIIFGLILIGGIAMVVLKRRQKKRRNYSLAVSGSDMSEISERLAERFRNERAKED